MRIPLKSIDRISGQQLVRRTVELLRSPRFAQLCDDSGIHGERISLKKKLSISGEQLKYAADILAEAAKTLGIV